MMLRQALITFALAIVITVFGLWLCNDIGPATWQPVKLQGVNCTMKKIKNPETMPKLRELEAALKAEAERQNKQGD